MINIIAAFIFIFIIIIIGLGISNVSDCIKDSNDLSRKENLQKRTILQFKECPITEHLINGSLNSYNDYINYTEKKEYLKQPVIQSICDTNEEFTIKQKIRQEEQFENNIKRHSISINELFDLSYDQENEMLIFKGLSFKNTGHNIHNGKINSGGKLISSCFGQSYISNDSNIIINLEFNHVGTMPSFSIPVKQETCKKLLELQGINVSLIIEINNVYHTHRDNSGMAYTNAMIELREHDTFDLLCSLKGFDICSLCDDEDEYFNFDENDFYKVKSFNVI